MPKSKILVLSGSLRPRSDNTKIAALAARQIEFMGAKATFIDLNEYRLPLYDARIQDEGMPTAAIALHELFLEHNGVFIASPEYNAFPTPLLLNTLDWVSRVKHDDGGTEAAFGRPVFAIGSASPSPFGGYRGACALRQKLELGLGAHVLPSMACIPAAYQAFDDEGNLVNEQDNFMLKNSVDNLITASVRCWRIDK